MSKLKKKLKTQGKNSKLKVKTQKVGIFRIPGCRKSVQKKPELASNVLSESKEETSEILITLAKPIPATAQIFSISLPKKAHELTTEKRKADKLLLQMLPPTVARQV